MASMANNNFGTPCKHIAQGIFAMTLTCKECRRIRQKVAEQLPTRKDKQKAKIAARRQRKYGD